MDQNGQIIGESKEVYRSIFSSVFTAVSTVGVNFSHCCVRISHMGNRVCDVLKNHLTVLIDLQFT